MSDSSRPAIASGAATTHDTVKAAGHDTSGGAAAASNWYDRLNRARFVFQCPEEMKVGEEYYAVAELNDDTMRLAMKRLDSMGHGARVDTVIRVGAEVGAELIADERDFVVHASSNEPFQLKEQGFVCKWSWTITPKEEGREKRLHLNVSTVVRGDQPKLIRSFDKTIVVTVTPWRRVVSFFGNSTNQWLIAGLGLPLIGLPIWHRRRKRRSARRGTSSEDDGKA
ncbi:MAG: hypothetical protein JST22_06660 [Bacteroidetes bacterium]|nr:hypothetical protein [Bacteroidota bacterium]